MPASPSHVILESTLESVHRSAMEDLMDSFGEQILQLFHRRNINLSSPLSWSTLFQSVSSGNGGSDRESTREVLEMVSSMASHFETSLRIHQAAQSNTLEQEQDVEEEEVKWGARGPCDDLWTVFERNRRGKRYPGDC